MGEAIEHICLKFIEQGSYKGPEIRCVVHIDSERNICIKRQKFIKGIGNKLFVAAVFQVM